MASNVGDKILATALIIGGLSAYWYIPYFLQYVKDLAAVSAPQPKQVKPQLVDDAEAAIRPAVVADLAEGPSHPLSAAAIRLAARRFVRDPVAKRGLLADLSSNEWQRRDQAVKALRLLLSNPALKESRMKQHFTDDATHQAIVKALVNLLPEHKRAAQASCTTASPVKPPNRPAHEVVILKFLVELLEEPRKFEYTHGYSIVNAQPAIDAGIITKWLARYPFPCTLAENRRYNFKQKDVVRLLERDVWGSDDQDMAKLVLMLAKLPQGARELADAGLKTTSIHDRSALHSRGLAIRTHPTGAWTLDQVHDQAEDEDSETGELIDDVDLRNRLAEPQPRNDAALSAGERSRQRRHRQAVVVAEAGAPLRPENILQRQPTQTELNWEQEVQGRQGELLRNGRAGMNGDDFLSADQVAREMVDGLDGTVWMPFQPPLPADLDDREGDGEHD